MLITICSITGVTMMPKRKADLEIGYRAYEELGRIFEFGKKGHTKQAIELLGCNRKTVYGWGSGLAPDAIHLAQLHRVGADIIYILTGERHV